SSPTPFPYTTLFRSIETSTEFLCSRNGRQVPAHMLACDAHAHHVAIEGVQRGQVIEQSAFDLRRFRRRGQLPGREKMIDFTKDRSEEHTSELQSREN